MIIAQILITYAGFAVAERKFFFFLILSCMCEAREIICQESSSAGLHSVRGWSRGEAFHARVRSFRVTSKSAFHCLSLSLTITPKKLVSSMMKKLRVEAENLPARAKIA